MLLNIFRITVRHLYRNSLYTLINVFGLAIGITVFLGVYTLTKFEYSFNKNVPDFDRVYRVTTSYSGSFTAANRGISMGVPAFIHEQFAGIESDAQIHTWGTEVKIPQGSGDPKEFDQEWDLLFTPSSFFETIGLWELEAGSIESLSEPNRVALLDTQAEKYFGELPASEYLGRTVVYRDSLEIEVAAIVSRNEGATDFLFTDFISSETLRTSWLKNNYNFDDWQGTSSGNLYFVKISENSSREALEETLRLAEENQSEKSPDDTWVTSYNSQSVTDMHFSPELGVFNNTSHAADPLVIRNLLLVAIAILLIAIINFVNLETALSGKRSREIGIRKVLGGDRRNLIVQFLVQSTMLTLVAVALSIPLTELGLSLFSDFLPDNLEFRPWDNVLFLVVLTGVVGLIAGIYPSMVLSAFKPVKVLKSAIPLSGGSKGYLRKGLTVVQFTLSLILLITTFIVYQQINFMLNKDLGFSSSNRMFINTPYFMEESKREVFENELRRLSWIDALSRFQNPPMSNNWSSSIYKYTTPDGEELQTEVFNKWGDSSYVNFFDIEIIAGRRLVSKKDVLINEAYLDELGYDEPREVLDIMIDPDGDSLVVAGVVKDFHHQTMRNKINPMVIFLREANVYDRGHVFGLKFNATQDVAALEAEVKGIYDEIYPDMEFESQVYSNTIEEFYDSDRKTSKLVLTSSVIALLISCMGLFGLSSFVSLQRTKEIGIRKVQGASVSSILKLLTVDFMKLVGISIIIAIPFAYWIGEYWLQEFAYRIGFNPLLYIVAGLLAVLVAFLTVSYHALSASRMNPVVSLRAE